MVRISLIMMVIVMLFQWVNSISILGTFGLFCLVLSSRYKTGAWRVLNGIKWDRVLYHVLITTGIAAVMYYLLILAIWYPRAVG